VLAESLLAPVLDARIVEGENLQLVVRRFLYACGQAATGHTPGVEAEH
jgi:hypothetical protein